jgi:hypothetical protein
MPRYMLDTDTCFYIMQRSNDALLKRLKRTAVKDVCAGMHQPVWFFWPPATSHWRLNL